MKTKTTAAAKLSAPGKRMAVEILPDEDKTPGGIIVPQAAGERLMKLAKVIASGSDAAADGVKPGVRVVLYPRPYDDFPSACGNGLKAAHLDDVMAILS